jgi:histone H3/H4
MANLPTATVQKIINEVLSTNPSLNADGQQGGMTFAKETRDVLIDCCVEFITMLSSEANDIAEKDAKKTIACEHITKALQELDFGEYVPELLKQADSFKSAAAVCRESLPVTRESMLTLCSASREETDEDRAEWYDQ